MGVGDEPEMGHEVAQHVRETDQAIDKKALKNAVLAAIVQTGTSGKGPGSVPLDGSTPTNVDPPVQITEFNSGFEPSVTYDWILGPDGKIYGEGSEGQIPPGPRRKLSIKAVHGSAEGRTGWVAHAEIINDKNMNVAGAMSGAPHSVYDEADSVRIRDVKAEASADGAIADKAVNTARATGDAAWLAQAKADQKRTGKAWSKAEMQYFAREEKFLPHDAATAVRQALVQLQNQGLLYDVSREDVVPAVAEAPPPSGRPPWFWPAVVVAVVAVAAIAALVLGGGSGKTSKLSSEDEAARARAASGVPTPTPATPKTVVAPAKPVCDVLEAFEVGQIVNRPMASEPQVAGLGCNYRATDEPNIDVTTEYPPYISQVSVNYNAPQAGLTEAKIAELFQSSRPPGAIDVPAGGAQAYSSGGGDAVVLDRGVMIMVSTSGTLRPESIPDVQRMCLAIADIFRSKLP